MANQTHSEFLCAVSVYAKELKLYTITSRTTIKDTAVRVYVSSEKKDGIL